MSSQCGFIKQNLENLLVYLEPLLPMANAHMVDYFSIGAFEKFIPEEIRREITDVGPGNAINLLFSDELGETPQLRTYVESTKKHTLGGCETLCLSSAAFQDILSRRGCETIAGLKLDVFMTSKKSHEVEVLSALAAAVRKVAGTSHLIDIGDGKGYLSSMLALHHKIPVLGVDASAINTDGAVKRVEKLSRIWNSVVASEKSKQTTAHLYRQVTQFVHETVDFQELVSTVFLEKPTGLGLVGLHTCGNLAPTSLRIFNSCEHIRTICNVGCCYHLITEAYEMDKNERSVVKNGFPMSQFLRNRNCVIGRPARMIAAQSVERILAKKELPNKTIFYRAVFEKLLEHCGEGLAGSRQVGRFRKAPKNFVDYVRQALKRIGAEVDMDDNEIQSFFAIYEDKIDELNVFYLIRCMLAPVVESVILLDRLLFLHEQGHDSAYLVQLFDPVVSPRCYGIVALK